MICNMYIFDNFLYTCSNDKSIKKLNLTAKEYNPT